MTIANPSLPASPAPPALSTPGTPKLSLARAISSNAQRLATAQTDYKTRVVLVNTFVNNVLSSSLPVLHQPPPDWKQFGTAYEQANGDALKWVNNVMGRLLEVPQDVVDSSANILALLQDAQQNAQILIREPSNVAAKGALQNDLQVLPRQLQLVTGFVDGAIKSVRGFANVLPDMAQQLTTIGQNSAKDAKADQGKIDDLLAAIQRLQDDINSMTASLIGFGVVDGMTITLGLITTIALWPVGALVWLVLGPAVALATTYIALDAKQIVADKAAITQKQNEITDFTADIATLQLLAQTYTNMANQTQAIEAALQQILAAWQTLEREITEAINAVNAAIASEGGADWTAVNNDLTSATTEWNQTVTLAGTLKLDIRVNNAQLQLGQSSESVQQSLAAGTSMDVIAYFNSIAA